MPGNRPQRSPDARHRYPIRCKGALAKGAAFTNGQILYEILPVFGSLNARVRALVTGAAATLDAFFLGPDFDIESQTLTPQAPLVATLFANLAGTIYATGGPAQTPLAAGTESKVDLTLFGEGYLLLKLTGQGSGAVSFIDLSQTPNTV
jgi:hypothetical protein